MRWAVAEYHAGAAVSAPRPKRRLALEEAPVTMDTCLLAALENAGIVTVHRPKPAMEKIWQTLSAG